MIRANRLTDPVEVPANASRFFSDQRQAQRQPTAVVELAWDPEDPYLFNAAFDNSLIRHDESYCTSVVDLDRVAQVPTADYFVERVVPLARPELTVIDIGCGQGEFVQLLRAAGVEASGFDPVLRSPSAHLHPGYWTPGSASADVFVMRCVLPHISDPWDFVGEMARHHPESLLLVEYQRLEWILDEEVWYQLSHDHVNLFRLDDFTSRFEVVDSDTFSNGEWAWVLIRLGAPRRAVSPVTCAFADSLGGLMAHRTETLHAAASSSRPLVIWGAAGKGIVLAHALQAVGAPIVAAIDADPLRQQLYMDVSGIPIVGPQDVGRLPRDAVYLVCNPNHLSAIQDRNGDLDLRLPRDLRRSATAVGRQAAQIVENPGP